MSDDPEVETEAEAQDEETVMPWIWGGIGLVVAAAFIALIVCWPMLHPIRHPAAAAPTFPAAHGP